MKSPSSPSQKTSNYHFSLRKKCVFYFLIFLFGLFFLSISSIFLRFFSKIKSKENGNCSTDSAKKKRSREHTQPTKRRQTEDTTSLKNEREPSQGARPGNRYEPHAHGRIYVRHAHTHRGSCTYATGAHTLEVASQTEWIWRWFVFLLPSPSWRLVHARAHTAAATPTGPLRGWGLGDLLSHLPPFVCLLLFISFSPVFSLF